MSKPRTPLPTLTEVIEVQSSQLPLDTGPAPLPPDSVPMVTRPATPVDHTAAITAEVLELLRPRIDALLEARIREALAPQVLRLAEESTQRIRDDLSGVMLVLVERAVVEAIARRRGR
jgi:hypothetical protein